MEPFDVDVVIERTAFGPAQWDTVFQQACDFASWDAASPVVEYCESVTECVLRASTAADIRVPHDAFEGRVFAENADLRWVMDEDGAIRAWSIKEVKNGSGPRFSNVCRAKNPRRFYLNGRSTNDPGVYREARYPGTLFEYPAAPSDAKREEGQLRAFLAVYEYWRAAPDWSRHATAEAVNRELAQPLLLAHRFVMVGEGSEA